MWRCLRPPTGMSVIGSRQHSVFSWTRDNNAVTVTSTFGRKRSGKCSFLRPKIPGFIKTNLYYCCRRSITQLGWSNIIFKKCFLDKYRAWKVMKFMFLQSVVFVTIETPPHSNAYQIIKWTVRFKKVCVRITLSVLRKRRPRKIYNLSWHDLNSHILLHGEICKGFALQACGGNMDNSKVICPLYLCTLTLNDLHNNFDTTQSRYSDLLTDSM